MERITETLNKVGASRKVLRRFAMLGTSVAFAGMLLLLLSGGSGSTTQAQTGSTTWSATITSGQDGDDYGYSHDDFGSIVGSRIVSHAGSSYTIKEIKWDRTPGEVELEFEECLYPSEFTSLTLGSRTFTDPDYTKYSRERCDAKTTRNQIFTFNTSSNPGQVPACGVGDCQPFCSTKPQSAV